MTSTELLLIFAFVSLTPVILFTNHTIQALKGSERVGVESRWGGIGGGGGGWGLTRPATWLLLTLFFSLFAAVLISATASSASEAEKRRDGVVLEINRRAVAGHQQAVAAMEAAETDTERAAALVQLKLALSSHEDAVDVLETLWGTEKPKSSETTASSAKPSTKSSTKKPEAVSPKSEEVRDLNPRAVDP